MEVLMATEHVVVGHFQYLDDTRNAIRKLFDKGVRFQQIELFTPFPSHELEEELYRNQRRSPVRRFTLLGGICGCLGAFLMTCWMSVDYPLRVSAKPLLSIPAFVVIAYECTILFGSLFNIGSMFHFSRIPNLFSKPAFRPQFTEGTFGVTVRADKAQAEDLKNVLRDAGAQEVEVQYVR